MKLKKAIQLVILDGQENPKDPCCDLENATKLLIEAGKRVQWHKEQHQQGYYELLPGETEE